jgi:plasmid rolling circle replication initiator protein Rep
MKPPQTTSEEGSVYLSDLSKKDKPWDDHKRVSGKVAGLYQQAGYEKYPERIKTCADRLEFQVKKDDQGVNHFKLHAARFCRVRYCPVCQWRKELMWRARFLKHIPEIIKDYPSSRFVFLTLTVKNCALDDLRETIAKMNKGWQRLSQRKDFPALGFVRSLEVTRGEDGSAHPHFHVMMMVRPSYFTHGYIKQADWTKLWRDCMRLDYEPIVNVKAVKDLKSNQNGNLPKNLAGGICETLKYSVKEADLISDPDWLDKLTSQMHKLRTVSLGGLFKEYLSEDDPEDLIHSELDEPKEETLSDESLMLFFQWNDHKRRYQNKQR